MPAQTQLDRIEDLQKQIIRGFKFKEQLDRIEALLRDVLKNQTEPLKAEANDLAQSLKSEVDRLQSELNDIPT